MVSRDNFNENESRLIREVSTIGVSMMTVSAIMTTPPEVSCLGIGFSKGLGLWGDVKELSILAGFEGFVRCADVFHVMVKKITTVSILINK
jgi:hypothetical protein